MIALNPRTQKLNLLQMECKLPLEMFESLMDVAMEGCNADLRPAPERRARKRVEAITRTRHRHRIDPGHLNMGHTLYTENNTFTQHDVFIHL